MTLEQEVAALKASTEALLAALTVRADQIDTVITNAAQIAAVATNIDSVIGAVQRANEAAASAAAALAIYGNTEAVQNAVTTAIQAANDAISGAAVYFGMQESMAKQAASIIKTQAILAQHHAFA